MTAGPDPEAFAALICDWCLDVQPGAKVMVGSTTLAEDYASALQRAILERDAWPFISLAPPSAAADLYRHGRERHFGEPPPIDMALLAALDSLFGSTLRPTPRSFRASTRP